MVGKEIHYNPVQLKVNAIKPKELVAIVARATGKTQGILAPRIAECVVHMPESTNGIITSTYKNFKTFVLGSLVSGWKALGFREWKKETGGHFTFGHNPKFPNPEYRVDDWTHIIHWYNGSICSLISQDRPGIGAGMSMQSLHGDEAYQLKEDRLKEYTFPALRGMPKYSKLIYYKMKTFTSSMPNTPDGYWLFKYQDKCFQDVIDYMFQVYLKIIDNEAKIADDDYGGTYKLQLGQENRQLNELLNELRKDCVYYIEADSFENYHILGESFFKDQKRDLPQHLFDSQILNLRPKGIELGQRFYGRLSDRHFYTDYDNEYFDKFTLELPSENDTCLGDLDCNRSYPLILTLDYGGKINSALICQEKPRIDSFNFLKEFFAEQQNKEHIEHCMQKVCDYYAPMTNRDIDFYDDVNGNKPMANSADTLRQTAVKVLERNGFNVYVKSGSTNPTHKDKWGLINAALSENDLRYPKVRINEGNCPNLKTALYSTPIRNVMGKLEKVKSSETNDKVDQKTATHITDAFDYVYYQLYKNKEMYMGGSGDTIY
jgi:hypothetical protein